jgi:hypothetical protein
MATVQRIGLGLVGAATTMIVRRLTRRTMHTQTGRHVAQRTYTTRSANGYIYISGGLSRTRSVGGTDVSHAVAVIVYGATYWDARAPRLPALHARTGPMLMDQWRAMTAAL